MRQAKKGNRSSRLKIGILYGGRSGEHDVSLCSAASVVGALDPKKYQIVAVGIDRDGRWHVQDSPRFVSSKAFGRILSLQRNGLWVVNQFEEQNRLCLRDLKGGKKPVTVDVVFPVLHGTYGEDGTLQGLLELARVPYVGVDVAGAAVGMDKDLSKRLLAQAGIPVVPWMTVGHTTWIARPERIMQNALKQLGLPVFVKPLCTGSSVGVVKVTQKSELPQALDYAFQFDTRIMIEQGIDCREIECAVLGNDEPVASVLGEILPRHDFYSYEAKYLDPEGAEMNIPAKLPARLAGAIRACAVAGYSALNCNAMARVDFFLEKATNRFYLNEINTLPGFTSVSMYPKLWEATGLPYSQLLDRLIELALERHRRKLAVRTDVP